MYRSVGVRKNILLLARLVRIQLHSVARLASVFYYSPAYVFVGWGLYETEKCPSYMYVCVGVSAPMCVCVFLYRRPLQAVVMLVISVALGWFIITTSLRKINYCSRSVRLDPPRWCPSTVMV